MNYRTVLHAMILAFVLGSTSAARVAAHHDEGCPELIIEAFGETAHNACTASYCESRWNPNARGAAGERGLYQIHPSWGARSTYDPEQNVMFALQLSRGGQQWSGHWVWCSREYGLP